MYTDYFPPSRLNPGRAWFVAPLDDDRSGLSWNNARNKIQSAVNLATSGDVIYVASGTYTEEVVIPFGLNNLSIIGVSGHQSAVITSSVTGKATLTCHATNCLFYNLWFQGFDTNAGSVPVVITGAYNLVDTCYLFQGPNLLTVGPGTNATANVTFPTQGYGGNNYFNNCLFTDAPKGVLLQASDFGASGENTFTGCTFSRLSTSSIDESAGSGGAAAAQFRGLIVKDCLFQPLDDGTEPTNYIILNDSNFNTGLVTGCRFTVSLTSAKNLVSTKCIWTGNLHPAGLSTGQPS